MESVLLVSGSAQGSEKLQTLFQSLGAPLVVSAASAEEAAKNLACLSFGLVAVNAPLTDGSGVEFAAHLTQTTTAGVLLLIRREDAQKAAPAEKAGAIVIYKPFQRELFAAAVRMCAASARRVEQLLRKNSELELKVEETNLIWRAKYVLVAHLNMTEPQAHRYIERQSMDLRISRADVARAILSTYE